MLPRQLVQPFLNKLVKLTTTIHSALDTELIYPPFEDQSG